MTPYRALDRSLDRITRRALDGALPAGRWAPPPAVARMAGRAVAQALCDLIDGSELRLAGPTDRPYPGEVLRRLALAYARALRRAGWPNDERPGCVYTPGWVADRLAQQVSAVAEDGASALDPACGAGSLLLAWRDRHPEALVTGWDVDGDALALAGALLELQARQMGVRAEAVLEAADLFETEAPPVAAVLLNPPYGTQLAPAARRWAERARWAPREPDCFALALERVVNGSRDAAVGAIVPDAIRMQPELGPLRAGLSASGRLRHIEPLEFGAFPGVTVRPCLLVLGPDRVGSRPEPAEAAGRAIAVDALEHGAGQCVVVRDELGRWPVEDPRAQALWGQCSQGAVRLGDLARCHEGVHTGNIRHKLLTDRPGGADVRPLLKGADITRFHLCFRGRYVRYAARHIDRSAGEYASLRDPAIFRGPKLLSRQTSDRLVVCLDDGDTVTDNSLHTVRLLPGAGLSLEWLALLLNSSLATALYRSQSEERHRPLPQIKLALLRGLPVRAPQASEAAVRALYRQAVSEAAAGGLSAATEAALDGLVFDSYGVPGSDRRWIQAALAPIGRATKPPTAAEPE